MSDYAGESAAGARSWTSPIDNYCERLDASFWSEPVNAATNAAFLVGAYAAWRLAVREARDDDWAVRVLVGLVTAIGIGSFLFHTFANRWSLLLDVIPIQLAILTYFYLVGVRYLAGPRLMGVATLGAALLAAPALGFAIRQVAPIGPSAGYAAVALLLAGFGALLMRRGHPAGRGILTGMGIFAVSLTCRMLDRPLCEVNPLGLHFMWHVLNGATLWWLMVVFVRHGRPQGRPALAPA